jgi:hypothetical protein
MKRTGKEIIIENKQEYLNNNNPRKAALDIDEKRRCFRCKEEINIREYKVYRQPLESLTAEQLFAVKVAQTELFERAQQNGGFDLICCPNAPGCTGTAIDWLPLNYKEQ